MVSSLKDLMSGISASSSINCYQMESIPLNANHASQRNKRSTQEYLKILDLFNKTKIGNTEEEKYDDGPENLEKKSRVEGEKDQNNC